MLHSRPEDVEGIAQEPATVLSTDLVKHLLGDSVLHITSGAYAMLLRSTSGRVVARLPSDSHNSWVWTSVWAPSDAEMPTETSVLTASMEIFVHDWSNLMSPDFRSRRAQPQTLSFIAPNLAGGLLEIVTGEHGWHFRAHDPPADALTGSGPGALLSSIMMAVAPHKHSLAAAAKKFEGAPDAMALLADCRIVDMYFHAGPVSKYEPGMPGMAGNGKAHNQVKYVIRAPPEHEGGDEPNCDYEEGPNNCDVGVAVGGLANASSAGIAAELMGSALPLDAARTPAISESLLPAAQAGRTASDRLRATRNGQSLFVVSGTGVLWELSWNGMAWVWLKHPHKKLPVTSILSVHDSLLVVTSGRPRLWSRGQSEHPASPSFVPTDSSYLAWAQVPVPTSLHVASAAPVDAGAPANGMHRPKFFVSTKGYLVVMRFGTAGALGGHVGATASWESLGMPPGSGDAGAARVGAIADAHVLRQNKAFVVDEYGRLFAVSLVDKRWTALPPPPDGVVLSLLPGAVSRPIATRAEGELFLRTEAGALVSVRWDGDKRAWAWDHFGQPGASDRRPDPLMSAPGGVMLGGDSVFAVGKSGKVWELKKAQEPARAEGQAQSTGSSARWAWKSHGSLQERAGRGAGFGLTNSTPVALGNDRVAFLTTRGHLLILANNEDGGDMSWMVVATPEAPLPANTNSKGG